MIITGKLTNYGDVYDILNGWLKDAKSGKISYQDLLNPITVFYYEVLRDTEDKKEESEFIEL